MNSALQWPLFAAIQQELPYSTLPFLNLCCYIHVCLYVRMHVCLYVHIFMFFRYHTSKIVFITSCQLFESVVGVCLFLIFELDTSCFTTERCSFNVVFCFLPFHVMFVFVPVYNLFSECACKHVHLLGYSYTCIYLHILRVCARIRWPVCAESSLCRLSFVCILLILFNRNYVNVGTNMLLHTRMLIPCAGATYIAQTRLVRFIDRL